MSLIFTSDELTEMQTAQEAHMMDVCIIGVFSQTRDDYKTPVDAWAFGVTEIPCGLEQETGSEELEPTKTVIRWDATLRLPIAQTVSEHDVIKIIKRHGVAITPIIYGIVSPIRRGPSGNRIRLKRIEPSQEAM